MEHSADLPGISIPILLGIAAVLHAVGIALALHALLNGRTPQGTIAWLIALVLLPYVAVPLYLVFGGRKFRGYVRARRSRNADLRRIVAALEPEEAKLRAFAPGDTPPGLAGLERLANGPFTRGNDARLLIDGEATFSAIFAGIEAARRYVLVQFFVIRHDALGQALKQWLTERVRAGVAVCVLYDEVGSEDLAAAYVAELRAAGVRVSPFNGRRARRRLYRRFQLNFRNHRKIVVVDGRTAWIGGLNVGDEYMGGNPNLSPWRDTQVEVTGPAVLRCQLSFVEDWYWATGEVPELDWTPEPAATKADRAALVLPSGPADRLETCALAFGQAIALAQRRLWIVSPYFVPDSHILAALQLAALRGVEVRVLVPDRVELLSVWLAGFSFLAETEGAGVKIHYYTQGFLHEKVMLIDDALAAVGTANLDNRSFRINFEMTLFLADRGFAADVERMLEADFARSRRADPNELARRPLWFRLVVAASRLLAPIL